MKLKKRLLLAAALAICLVVPQAEPLPGDESPAAGMFADEFGGCTVIMVLNSGRKPSRSWI
jgi:hypothetical protein